LILATVLLTGCGGSDAGSKPGGGSSSGGGGGGWLGIPSACKSVVEWVNEGTNWVLNKNQVSIAKVGEVRPVASTDTFIADFKIAVTNGTNSFETIAKEVSCDKDGIPTENSLTKLREAVEDIKAKIKRLQS
jgi:hypothetical protein